MINFSQKLKKENIIFIKKIIINIIVIILIWILFYNFIRKISFIDYIYEEGIYFQTKIQLIFSKLLLNIFGYDIEIYGKTIKIIGSYGVHLDRGCLGRNTLGLFIGFILVFPGNFLNKLWFMILGVIIFIFLNVSRIVALTIIENICPQNLDFNHHFTFKIIVYIVIFFLWTWWIRKYSLLKKKNSPTRTRT